MKSMSGAAVVATVLMAGCATAPTPLAPTARAEMVRYHAIAVDSVRLAPELAAALGAEDTQAVERQLHLALVEELPPAARAVTPGPGVMHLEVTVTELEAVNPGVNALTTALLFVPLDQGGVGFEARFYDAPGGKLLAQTTQHHSSTPLEIKGSFSRYGHAVKAMREWAAEIGKTLAAA